MLKKMNVPNIEQYIKIFDEGNKIDVEDINNIFGKEVVTKKKVILPKGYENIFKNIEKTFYLPAIKYLVDRGLTKEDIFDAFKVYQGRLLDAYFNNNELYYFNNNGYNLWGGGDTLDRERVRDIILEQPQFTFGG